MIRPLQEVFRENPPFPVPHRKKCHTIKVSIPRWQRDIKAKSTSPRGCWDTRIHVATKGASKPCRNWLILTPGQMDRIAIITGKQFIAAISRQSYGDVLPRNLRHVISWHRRRVSERLLHHWRQLLQYFVDIRFNDELVVLSMKPL